MKIYINWVNINETRGLVEPVDLEKNQLAGFKLDQQVKVRKKLKGCLNSERERKFK